MSPFRLATCAAFLALSTSAAAQPPEEGALGLGARAQPATTLHTHRVIVLRSDLVDVTALTVHLQELVPFGSIEVRDAPPLFLGVDQMLDELGAQDAIAWLEELPGGVRLVVVDSDGVTQARSLAVDTPLQDLAVAMGQLLRASSRTQHVAWRGSPQTQTQTETETERVPRHRTEPNEGPTAPARAGFFRVGIVLGSSPANDFAEIPSQHSTSSAGFRLAVGLRLRDLVSVGISGTTLHASGVWNGSLNINTSIHTKGRLRIGAGLEIGILIAREQEQASARTLLWASPRVSLPFEFSYSVGDMSAIGIRAGPTMMGSRAGTFFGYNLSLEYEYH